MLQSYKFDEEAVEKNLKPKRGEWIASRDVCVGGSVHHWSKQPQDSKNGFKAHLKRLVFEE